MENTYGCYLLFLWTTLFPWIRRWGETPLKVKNGSWTHYNLRHGSGRVLPAPLSFLCGWVHAVFINLRYAYFHFLFQIFNWNKILAALFLRFIYLSLWVGARCLKVLELFSIIEFVSHFFWCGITFDYDQKPCYKFFLFRKTSLFLVLWIKCKIILLKLFVSSPNCQCHINKYNFIYIKQI
jgi:hypothetical protein